MGMQTKGAIRPRLISTPADEVQAPRRNREAAVVKLAAAAQAWGAAKAEGLTGEHADQWADLPLGTRLRSIAYTLAVSATDTDWADLTDMAGTHRDAKRTNYRRPSVITRQMTVAALREIAAVHDGLAVKLAETVAEHRPARKVVA